VNVNQIEFVDKYNFKHPKKIKNGIFFKIDLINPDDIGKRKDELSTVNTPNKSNSLIYILENRTTLDAKIDHSHALDEDDEGELKKNITQKKIKKRYLFYYKKKKGKARKMILISDKDDDKDKKKAKSKLNYDNF